MITSYTALACWGFAGGGGDDQQSKAQILVLTMRDNDCCEPGEIEPCE